MNLENNNILQPSLEHELVKLKPLLPNDFDALYQVAADPLIWEQHPNKNRYQKEVFQTFFKGAIDSNGAFLIYDAQTGDPIGTSRFYDLDIENKSILIGYTFLSRSYWGKAYNKAVKKLMLEYAFTFVEKVIFHIGSNNIRSQKAIEKLGAIKIGEEGIAYYGEQKNMNFIYKIEKKNWLEEHKE